jgi:hypothetical protein
MKDKIEKLLTIKRVNNVTQNSNVSLCNAIDHVTIGGNYTESAFNRLYKAIVEDMEWNPWAYSNEDLRLIKRYDK